MYANAQRWVFRAALNDSNESLDVTETGNAFQTVAAAFTTHYVQFILHDMKSELNF